MEVDNIKRIYSPFYDVSKMCAEEIIKRLKDNNQKALLEHCLEELESAVRTVSSFENNTYKENQALDEIEQHLHQDKDPCQFGDLSEMLKEKLAQSKSTECWTERLEDYKASVKEAFESLDLANMIVASSENIIDPYSKKPIQHPVKTRFCNHTFEKTNVLEILSNKRDGQLRCPYMGCNKVFTAHDLVEIEQENGEEDSD